MTERETVLNVVGMTCGSCAKRVDRALRGVAGVDEVEVRMREKQAVVRHPEGAVSGEALITALREAGYDGTPVASSARPS